MHHLGSLWTCLRITDARVLLLMFMSHVYELKQRAADVYSKGTKHEHK